MTKIFLKKDIIYWVTFTKMILVINNMMYQFGCFLAV